MIKFKNEAHLGDCLLQVNYMNRLAEPCELYCAEGYIEELRKFVKNPTLTSVRPIEELEGYAENCWINSNEFFQDNDHYEFQKFLIKWFEHLSDRVSVESPIKTEEDTLIEIPGIDLTKDFIYDILLVNSLPLSGQWDYKRGEWEQLARELSQRASVITTEQVDDLPCTRTTAPGLFEIASLAPYCRNIVGIHTSPMLACLNTEAFKRVEEWYVCDRRSIFTYGDNFINADIDIIRKAFNG